MNYLIKELVKTMKMLDKASREAPRAKLDPKAVANGMDLSKRVCSQPLTVVATPLMKNLLVSLGDITQKCDSKGEWHTEKLATGKKSKAVAWINDVVKACLQKFNGPEQTSYPLNLSVGDPKLYDIDCWNGWKPEIWDIQPGQAEQRRKAFLEFKNDKTAMSVDQLIKIIERDETLQKAIEVEFSLLPEVQASREVRAISDPFMSKKTGVSYPDYRNDATTVPGTSITYGKYEIDLAAKAAEKGIEGIRKFAFDNNVYTAYPRNQRGKGRPLIAQSRRTNLIINMINRPEMEQWKQTAFIGTAFQNEETILKNLSRMAEWIEANPEYYAANKDYTNWDRNLGIGWITLQNAMRYLKAQGTFSKELVKIRHSCNTKAWFIDGPNNSVYTIFGRMFSGYDDTTLGNTTANRVASRALAMSGDSDYTKKVTYPSKKEDILCVGDDFLGIMKRENIGTWHSRAKEYGLEAHEGDKDAVGVMFIQYRVIRRNGKWIMAYNWPRVLRSMLSKEDTKNLGKGGWTLSFYQQLGKLFMYDEMLSIVLNIAAALDKDHLMLNTPVSDIIKMVKVEDQDRVKKGTANRGKKMIRTNTTAERLFNGNPNLPGVVDKNGKIELDRNYFVRLQKKFKELYDPQFLTKIGFKNPDLSKVH